MGYGAGAGMALIMVFSGLAMTGVGLGGYGVRVVRDAESILPDHEVVVELGGHLREQLQDLIEQRQNLITQPVTIERDQELKRISLEIRDLGRR